MHLIFYFKKNYKHLCYYVLFMNLQGYLYTACYCAIFVDVTTKRDSIYIYVFSFSINMCERDIFAFKHLF